MVKKETSRRLTDYLHDYWKLKKAKAAFPKFEDINIDDIDLEYRNDCFLIEIEPKVTLNITKMIFLGKNLNTEFKQDKSGVHIKNLVVRFLETPLDHYNKVIESKKPLIQNVEIPSKEDPNLMYRQILLPLGNAEKGDVRGILGGMRYK